ncbi:DMT family transporter [Azospirillum griseum]|uniref:DMT family transporter n=1 Tax=Azospirillum griseum TaxID=2496639 RepID=A0A431VDQ7_9PROT|nr:DMT family transporter [Azospirillum griseum]RTR17380.1 DMT family transporter [Azospirillum griseum]
MLAYLAALGTATCWAVGGLIAIGPVRAIGSIAFNRLRLCVVALGLLTVATLMGGWASLDAHAILLLILSGVFGIVVGDLALFWSLSRLGPRRNVVVYAANAPLTALLAWLALGEALSAWTILGILLVTAGVMLAVALRSGSSHSWEAVQGSLVAGVGVCLIGACGQAIGSVIAKPVMASGVDPVAAAAVRVAAGAVMLTLVGLLPGQNLSFGGKLTPKIALLVVVNGAIGIGLGMTLLLVALASGNAGVVATLSALSPVLILPMLWLWTGQRPGQGAWAGAAVAVAGVALIVNR